MVSKLEGALISGVADVADFGRLVSFPLLVMELQVKLLQVLRGSKVHERISNIAVILNKHLFTSLSMGR